MHKGHEGRRSHKNPFAPENSSSPLGIGHSATPSPRHRSSRSAIVFLDDDDATTENRESVLNLTLEEAAIPRSASLSRKSSLKSLARSHCASSPRGERVLDPITPRRRPPAPEVLSYWQTLKVKLFPLFVYYFLVLPALFVQGKTDKYTASQTKNRQIKMVENQLHNTNDKESWDALALQLDELRGYNEWRVEKPAHVQEGHCQASKMIAETQAIYRLIDSGCIKAQGEFIRTHLLRNSHGSDAPELYAYYSGTKQYVQEYQDALADLISVFGKGTAQGTSRGLSFFPEELESIGTCSTHTLPDGCDGDVANSRKTHSLFNPPAALTSPTQKSITSTSGSIRQNTANYVSWLEPVEPSLYSQSIVDYALKNPAAAAPSSSLEESIDSSDVLGETSRPAASASVEAEANVAEDAHVLSDTARLKLLVEAGRSYGRSCLLLSGGASLGVYHMGVVRALLQNKLLPKIMCGSSAGALMGSLICTRNDVELEEMFGSDATTVHNVCFKFFEHIEDVAQSVKTKVDRLMGSGGFMDVDHLQVAIRENCGDMTFLEAFERTGRIFNVSVAADREGEKSLLLNYINTPNVVLWAGVGASCCMPGMFSAIELAQKDPQTNEIIPYMPGQLWFDGSVANDLPKKQLSEMFHCNFFIVSQVNPHVVPFAKNNAVSVHKKPTSWKKALWFAGSREVFYWLKKLYRSNLLPKTGAAEIPYLMATQDYEGDLTIYPVGSVWAAIPDFVNLTTNPTDEHVAYVGELSLKRTRPHMNQLRVMTEVERVLEVEIKALAAKLEFSLLRRSASTTF